jgi:acetolactate synthase-1/2/3 large subunit
VTGAAIGARTGGQVLADQLRLHGTRAVYCVPGESYLGLLDALAGLRDEIDVVACRQEGGAAVMAEAHGKLTGRVGVCAVTRGPGATNASIGLHTAAQDSSPMLLLAGQVARGHLGREAFQELDLGAVFGTMAKWVATVHDPARLPELVARAFTTALSGRPGPVVLGLPEDVLTEVVTVADAAPAVPAQPAPGQPELTRLRELLAAAERPLVIAGGPGWTQAACDDLLAFATASSLPVAVSFRSQDVVDNTAAAYAGHLGTGRVPAGLDDRVKAADLLVVIGPRLGEITTAGYTLLGVPRPAQALVHVHPDPEELGSVHQAELPIVASTARFAAALRELEPIASPRWAPWAAAARAAYEAALEPLEPPPAGVDLAEVFTWLRDRLPADAIMTNGAGNFSGWAHRFHQFRRYRTQLGPTSGAMGYALPAALAAKHAEPGRVVLAVTGDGDFLMTGQELATAVRHDLAVIVLVVDNGQYGTIRMHQIAAHPGRPIATSLANPDFAAFARSFGVHGETVEAAADFPAAFERAAAAGGPALICLRTDPDTIAPGRVVGPGL